MFSESIVIGLTAQGLSLYSPFWSPVIGRKPVNGISLLGILLSIGYISVVTMPVQAIFWIEQEKVCASAVVQGRQVRAGDRHSNHYPQIAYIRERVARASFLLLDKQV